MYGLSIYIAPEDIIGKLSDEYGAKFNQCVFTDVIKERDGTITIKCMLFNDPDSHLKGDMHKQKYYNSNLHIYTPKLETK